VAAKRVLFLCTGNYYRSRFAEELFNHYCRESKLEHRADSRGLALERGWLWNFGPMSRNARRALEQRGVAIEGGERRAKKVGGEDFDRADLVIALDEAEHRPLVESRFPKFAGRVRYWNVHDIGGATPEDATAQIDILVRKLIEELESGKPPLSVPKPGISKTFLDSHPPVL
jgi:protein-tyrosine phosphatase